MNEMQELDDFEAAITADTKQVEDRASAGKTFYFAVPSVAARFVQKADLKKFLEKSGLTGHEVIKGRYLPTGIKTITKIEF